MKAGILLYGLYPVASDGSSRSLFQQIEGVQLNSNYRFPSRLNLDVEEDLKLPSLPPTSHLLANNAGHYQSQENVGSNHTIPTK